MSGNKNRVGGRIGFVIGCVLIYFFTVGIILGGIKVPATMAKMKVNAEIKKSKVVLYDGPKSLKDATDADLKFATEEGRDFEIKHCVDTKVLVNGKESYVYDTNVNNTHTWVDSYLPGQERTPITYFDFDGTVEITVEVPKTDINYVTVRPLKYGIKPQINKKKHTVTFTVDTPDSYTVEFNNNVKRAVHIFANEIEENLPDFDSEDVLYIGPGEWNIENIMLEDNQTLYISGGAVVHGIVNANFVKNVKVRGRGIIDGSTFNGWKGRMAKIPLKFDNCTNFSIEGVIALNPNAWVLQSYDSIGGKIKNVKIISSRPNGDGITLQSCNNIQVKNCFVRTWDDSLVVKNYDVNTDGITFDNVQVWTDLAQSMEIGYETNKGNKENSKISNIRFENITVLHNFHKPVLSIHNADNALVKDISYKNIVVEEATVGKGDGTPELMDIGIVNSGNWSTTMDRGQVENVTIDGFKVLYGNDSLPSKIKGYDAEHIIKGVHINNLEIKGKKIKSLEDGEFTVDDKTDDITIK
ncbi:MAG: hypothetical protein K6G88_13895 [Lachnospiraceae bacterium]|nr:hypothetical protein [Lachnospiraceae bacterium]